jgi:hypothetical protein
MEYLALVVILYFILRAMGNLIRLLRGRASETPREEPSDASAETSSGTAHPEGWSGPSPRQETGAARKTPTFWDEDVDDATWRDL